VRSKGTLQGLDSILLQIFYTTPDLQFDNDFMLFGGHLQGGRIIELLQPARAVPVPDPVIQRRTIIDMKVLAIKGKKLILY
jgi:hypothetical protein